MKLLRASFAAGLLVAVAATAVSCSSRGLVRTEREHRAEIPTPSEGLMPEVVVTAERPTPTEAAHAVARPGGSARDAGLELMFYRPLAD